ncbi:MAG: hypothetical protein NTW29_05425 [Bacteroidetes bacterium]|nr:hypothetical protein [Bacteroidota bacterium]
MAKQVLVTSVSNLNDLSTDQIITKVQNDVGVHIKPLGKAFTDIQVKGLAALLDFSANYDDSDFISEFRAEKMKAAFDENPNLLETPRALLEVFLKRVDDLVKNIPIPAEHDWFLRFYLGFDMDNKYGIVVIPYHGLKGGKNHDEDVENRLWSKKYTFFALVPSLNVISTVVAQCQAVVENKDSSGILLAYITLDSFKELITNFTAGDFVKIVFSFARIFDDANKLTIITTAFNAYDKYVIVNTEKTSIGICYDQVDLIPPPNGPVPDTSLL